MTPTPTPTPTSAVYSLNCKGYYEVGIIQPVDDIWTANLYSYNPSTEIENVELIDRMQPSGGIRLGMCIKVDKISGDKKWVRLAKEQNEGVDINPSIEEFRDNYFWIRVEVLVDSVENLIVEEPDKCLKTSDDC
jgi:hypothetical protein